MKIAVRMFVCAVLIVAAVSMAARTVTEFRRADAARAAGYVLGEADGAVAVFAGGDLKTPLEVTDIETASLRSADRALIAAGVHAASREEVLQLLEDLND